MKKENSLFADTKQQVNQIKRKLWQISISQCLFKKESFLKFKTTIFFPVEDTLIWYCLGSQLNLSTVSFAWICSIL